MRARDDLPSVPRSLFDCPQTIAQRLEREGHLLKPNFFKPVKAQLQAAVGMNRAALEPLQDHPEWLIHEDWALLQVGSVNNIPLLLISARLSFGYLTLLVGQPFSLLNAVLQQLPKVVSKTGRLR